MKVLDIAFKDLFHSLRSAFLLVMMFVAPFLITGLIYLAFGGLIDSGGGLKLPRSSVLVANLDRPSPASGLKAGELLAHHLSDPAFSELLAASPVADEASARAAVDARQADVAVIIPANFSSAAQEPQQHARVTLYHHPDAAISARVVKIILGDFVDGIAGAKIAIHVAEHQLEAQGLELPDAGAELIARAYIAWVESAVGSEGQPAIGTNQTPLLVSRAPVSADRPANQATLFLGPVMAGMVVFFMFFTGAAAAQSILYEEQDGTLARLFTTPAPRWVILAGKMLAVVITLALQGLVLLALAAVIFRIQWGHPASVALLTTGVVVAASGFGILLMSFVRTIRQAGPVTGLVVTLTGMLGGLMPTGDPSQAPSFEKLTLALPQGWAMRGWRLALAGSGPVDLLLPTVVLIASGVLLFAAGALLFRRRFA